MPNETFNESLGAFPTVRDPLSVMLRITDMGVTHGPQLDPPAAGSIAVFDAIVR